MAAAQFDIDSNAHAHPDTYSDPTPSPSGCINPLGTQDLYLQGGMSSWNAVAEYKFNYVCDHFELVTGLG